MPNNDSENSQNTEILEVKNLTQKMKAFGDIIPWNIRSRCQELEIVICNSEQEICKIVAAGFENLVDLRKNNDVYMVFKVKTFAVYDNNAEVFKEIVLKAPPFLKAENDSLQFKAMIEVQPRQDKIDVSLGLNQMFAVVNPELILKFIKITEEVKKIVEKSFTKAKVPVTYTIVTTKLQLLVQIQGIELWIPVFLSNPNTNIITISSSAMVIYNSFNTTKKKYDSL